MRIKIDGKVLKQPIQDLLSASGVKLANDGGFKELVLFYPWWDLFSVEIHFRTRNFTVLLL